MTGEHFHLKQPKIHGPKIEIIKFNGIYRKLEGDILSNKKLVISIICVILGLGSGVEVLAKSKANRKPSSKNPPAPLECLGGNIETRGHALVITPKLGRPLKKNERKFMSSLAQQDPVELLQVSDLFKEADTKQVLEMRIDPTVAEAGFSSLKDYVKTNKFKTRVPLKLAALLDKDDKEQIASTQDILDDLNNVDLRTLKKQIISKWKGPENDDGDETVFF